MSTLQKHWEDLRSSLWFIPTLIVLGAIVLAVALIEVDSPGGRGQLAERWPRLFGAGAESSRGLLSTIAGSMITVAGVSFSITVVALTLASSQYTPRILRSFMRDRANQTVLGVFLAIFAYCLVVLRTIRSGEDAVFVPGLAVIVGVLLAFIGIGFLVFFIHHIAVSLQATSIIESVARETLEAIDRLYPDPMSEAAAGRSGKAREGAGEAREGAVSEQGRSGEAQGGAVSEQEGAGEAREGAVSEQEGAGEAQEGAVTSRAWATVPARQTGYIQGIDVDAVFDFAKEQGVVVRMEKGVGEFVIEACPLASVSGKALDDEMMGSLHAAYSVSGYRTAHQDVDYGIQQIVDVALKALSPGINDTTTAINCVDYLASILSRLAVRVIESPSRSEGGQLRVISRGPTFPSLLAAAFDQIRQNAKGNVAVLVRLHQALATVAGRTADEQRRTALHQHAVLIAEVAERSVPSAHDRATIQAAQAGST